MTVYITQVLMAFLGTLGFSIVFKSKNNFILPNSLGGGLVWISYLIFYHFSNHIFLSYMLSAILSGLYSETIARIYKTPATTVLIPVLVVLIPGSSLYYTIQALFNDNISVFVEKGTETVTIATAIAIGIIIVSTILKIANSISQHKK